MSRELIVPRTQVLPLTTIRRERMLAWHGEVLVGIRQPVEPSDVVARAGRPRPPLILDIAKKMGISSAQADRHCLKRPGEIMQQGETIAQTKAGLWGTRRITSPVEGRVVDIKAGRMIIEPRPELFELRAILSGMVVSVTPGFGVTIETPGALMQGVWGSGQESYGVLKVVVSEPDAILAEDRVEASHHGAILVCGATLTRDILAKALEFHVRGLVVGGVPAGLRDLAARSPIPVIAMEGMGCIPISSVIFNLLRANEGREAMLLAAAPDRWPVARPEIIIPLPASATPDLPPSAEALLTSGAKVRIRGQWGTVGTVKTVYDEPRNVASGIKHLGADIVLEDGKVVFVPYVNLDLIG